MIADHLEVKDLSTFFMKPLYSCHTHVIQAAENHTMQVYANIGGTYMFAPTKVYQIFVLRCCHVVMNVGVERNVKTNILS